MARQRKGNPVHGWIVIDKSLDITSTQVVGRVRRLFKAQKAGHGGTLDPLAVGILPIALGEATKTMRHLTAAEKKYRFTIKWGEQTETDDREGAVVATSDCRPSDAAIEGMLPRFVGDIVQVPPVYSAIKVDGRRAYDLARQNKPVNLAARPVRIDRLALIAQPDADHAVLEMDCGKGGYVRALARDLALKLGTRGHVTALRRTRVGSLGLDRAISLAELEALEDSAALSRHLLPVERGLCGVPAMVVNADQATRLRHGQAVPLVRAPVDLSGNRIEGPALVCAMFADRPAALVQFEAGEIRPTRVFTY